MDWLWSRGQRGLIADITLKRNYNRFQVAEIDGVATLLALGHNRSGPRDGLYIIEEADGFRVYTQEGGIAQSERSGMSFDEARDAVIDRLVMLNGIPYQF